MSEPDPPDLPQPLDTATSAVRDFAEQLKSVVDTACALVASNRDVDLTGLDREIGLLCAKSLDLPPDEGRRIRPRLIALFGSVEGLSRAFRARDPPSG
jgi:hypothetical protein